MTEYYISEMDGSSVSIGLNEPKSGVDGWLDGFIDIHTDECNLDSPFKDLKTARAFAEIIVKLLKVVG